MQNAIAARKTGLKLPRWLVLLAATGVVAAGAAVGLYVWSAVSGGGEVTPPVVTSVSLAYPNGWIEQPVTLDDKRAGILLKLERSRPSSTFLARTVIARLASDFDINQLADDTERALAVELEGFDLLSKGVATVGPYDAVMVSYRQPDANGVEFETLMAIVPTEIQTFYLTLRAETDSFPAVENEGLALVKGFVSYVASQ